MKKEHLYFVIMCGGVGSRFWPFSRTSRPKQFIDFFGTGRSLLQMTFDRVIPLTDPAHVLAITNALYAPMVAAQLPEIPPTNILQEPARRNTAPCICWAAHHIYARDPEAVIITLPSDHLILKEDEFRRSIEEAAEFANRSRGLVTLGICPSFPHTGYGYIQKGKEVADFPGIKKVKSFTEKPDEQMAAFFLSSGEFFWNAGVFIWRADAILKAFSDVAPDTAAIFDQLSGALWADPVKEMEFIDREYPNAPSNSIDYEVMEKADNAYVKTVEIGWSDVGSWKALYDVSPQNADKNVTQNSKVLAKDCTGSIFASDEDKIIVAVGLKDYIVAENGNALIICPIAQEQRIRHIVNDVKGRFGENYV